jgi:molybdopterin synthase catalytic subunit
MQVEVLLFAALREALGSERITVELASGATGRDLREKLVQSHPQWRMLFEASRVAQGVEFVDDDRPLAGGEAVALIPPVSGGAPSAPETPPETAALVRGPISVADLEAAAAHPRAGAVCTFQGTVRSPNQGRDVLHLEYEAHETMALARMQRIVDDTRDRWDGARVFLHHRLGRLFPGEPSVVIVVSTPHRAASFEACRHVIERLKEDVPIWKKEVFADGSTWVGAPSADAQP